MKKTKIFLVVLLSLFIFTAVTVYGDNITKTIQVTYRNISILANGKQIQSEQEPFIYQGHTFVPLKTIGEALNKKIDWDNVKNQVVITDQVNPNPTVRMDSFYSLMNYLPDNYSIEKNDKILSNDELLSINNMTEKYLKSIYKNFKFNLEKISQKSFNLKSYQDDLSLYIIYTNFELTGNPLVYCIKYEDGKLYYILSAYSNPNLCGCSDGWVADKIYWPHDSEADRINLFYISYLAKINNSIVMDKPNRTKQITLLNSIMLNSEYLNIFVK